VRDGPPQIDDLEAFLKQFRNVCCRQMTVNSVDCRLGRLIDVYERRRLTGLRRLSLLSRVPSTDS
jgi:hypothetical protein